MVEVWHRRRHIEDEVLELAVEVRKGNKSRPVVRLSGLCACWQAIGYEQFHLTAVPIEEKAAQVVKTSAAFSCLHGVTLLPWGCVTIAPGNSENIADFLPTF